MRFGRHELVSKEAIKKLCDAADAGGKTVLEIGAGTGNITEELAKRARKVIAVEIDLMLCQKLRSRLPSVGVVQADALSMDFPECDCIVSNMPFDISSPLFEKIVRSGKDAAIIVQQEFADKVASEFLVSRLSFIAWYLAEMEIVFRVQRSAYMPRPPVDTCILKIKPRKQKPDEHLFRFVSEMISHRLKTVLNTLLSSGDLFREMDRNELREKLKAALGDLADLRPWDLYYDEVIEIYRKVGGLIDKER